jgi:hypothetical protein
MSSPGDGRNQVLVQTVCDPAWANAIADRTIQSYASQAVRDQQWGNPRNGSIAYTADTDEFWVRRGSAWSRLPAGYQGGARGPAANTNVGNAWTTLIQYNFPVKINRHYLVIGYANGGQRTKGGGVTGAQLADDQGGAQYICWDNLLEVNASLLGTTTYIYTPTSTKTAWIKLQAITQVVGGVYYFPANACSVFVTDVGGV